MILFGIVLGICLMGGMVYMAVDKKSNFPTRVASLIALAVMILTIIICLFIVFTDTTVPVDESVLIVGAPVEVKETNSNDIFVMMLLILFLIVLFIVIAVLTMKEHKKSLSKIKGNSPSSKW